MNVDSSRLLRLAIAGAVAGFIIFLIFNPSMVREELAMREKLQPRDLDQTMDSINSLKEEAGRGDPTMALLFTGGFGALAGALLALADEFGSPAKRALIKMGMAAACGAVVGGASGIIADQLFAKLISMSLLFLIPARVAGWSMMGVGAGAGIGLALGSRRRFLMSTLGGLIGGFLGGWLFDTVSFVSFSDTGTFSRLMGFTLMGLVTGAAVAFVEDMAKQSWVTVLSGPKEGRSFILSKEVTTIGRDELADIPLFGDMSVAKQHAFLHMDGPTVTLQSATGAPVAINGAPATVAQLRPWDTFCIGRIALRFHQKGGRHAAMRAYLQQSPYAQSPQPRYTPAGQTTMGAPTAVATGNLTLRATAGPHMNAYFQFGPGTVRIGREAGCGVLLAHDTMISRIHAEITWDGSRWTVRDLNSRNGLWVNGVRVSQHALSPGDQIGLGQTWLQVESI